MVVVVVVVLEVVLPEVVPGLRGTQSLPSRTLPNGQNSAGISGNMETFLLI